MAYPFGRTLIRPRVSLVRGFALEPSVAYSDRENILFVDVREPYEWAAGRIEGSMHIPLRELQQRHDEIPAGQTIVVVCQIGQRSGLAAGFLSRSGFEAFNLEGGLDAWVAKGLPLQGEIAEGFAQVFPP